MNPEETPENPLSQIRTYQGDVAEAIEHQNESLVSIQQTEAARRRAAGTPAHTENTDRKKAILLTLGSLVLIVLATVGGWYTYREYISKTALPEVVTPDNQFISPTVESDIVIATTTTRAELIKLVRDQSNIPLTTGGIRHLELRQGTVSGALVPTNQFVHTLETNAPSALVRSFNNLFMLGNLGTASSSTFMIIKLASFENAYAGMLDWEADIATDLGPLFPTAPNLQNLSSSAIFQDVTYKNKDSRILYDNEGDTILLYSFLDNDLLIITDSLDTLNTVITRLRAESLTH